MSRVVLSIAVVAGLLSSQAWALPQSSSCRAGGRARVLVVWAPICALSQDPWQDCDEDPWQLSSFGQADERFSDPWQDGLDPWQPTFVAPMSVGTAEVDPWQPNAATVAAKKTPEDPWQPTFADPWQDGADDPWQLP